MASFSTLPGRLGMIADKYYLLSNQIKGGTDTSNRYDTSAYVLIWIDQCIKELAREKLFQDSQTYDLIANEPSYNWTALLPDTVQIIGVTLNVPGYYDALEIRNWEDFLGRIGSVATDYSDVVPMGMFTKGNITYMVGTPTSTTTDGLRIARAYLPSSPGVVTLDVGQDVTDNEDGTVAFPATGHGLLVSDEVDIVTVAGEGDDSDYSGNYHITAVTTDTFSVTASFEEHTIGANDTCFLQPRWPEALDDLLVYYCLRMHYLRDRTDPKQIQLGVWNGLYEKTKVQLKEAFAPPSYGITPARGTW